MTARTIASRWRGCSLAVSRVRNCWFTNPCDNQNKKTRLVTETETVREWRERARVLTSSNMERMKLWVWNLRAAIDMVESGEKSEWGNEWERGFVELHTGFVCWDLGFLMLSSHLSSFQNYMQPCCCHHSALRALL